MYVCIHDPNSIPLKKNTFLSLRMTKSKTEGQTDEAWSSLKK